MKTGRTLTELAQEIERQAQAKQDYLADTRAMEMVPAEQGADLVLTGGNGQQIELAVNPLAHEQIATYTDIPKRYYDRMLESEPALLAQNVNRWLQKKPATRMIRTLDNRARAFMSNSYRPLDYVDLAESVLPALMQMNLQVLSCEITERRLYLKAVDRSIEVDIPTGKKMGDGSHTFFDTLSPAIVISNSEVGAGALSIETAVWTRVCTNLAIQSQRSMKKYHLGARADIGDEMFALLSENTRKLTDAALWSQVRDVVKGAFDKAKLEAYSRSLIEATEVPIVGDPVKAVEVMAKKIGITETERPSILRHLITGGDLSQYGMANAVTRAAEDLVDYDRATEFERLGGRIIELPRSEWKAIGEAA